MDLLTGGKSTPAEPTEWGTTKPGQEIVDKLYDNKSAPQRELYPIEKAIEHTLDSNLTRLGDALGMSRDAQLAERTEFPKTMRAAGLDQSAALVEDLHKAFTSERIAATQPVDDTREAAAMAAEAAIRDELRGQYGDRLYADLLARAQKLVASNPKLKAIVETGRVSSRPEIVRGLIEHVRAVNYR